ncbi:MAG: penicillin-binding protein 2, partial [Candidatus Omnitrophica bacterium]|nr:penicillin-binding protein 2 [Candidatus Omnitrophota bacterium]
LLLIVGLAYTQVFRFFYYSRLSKNNSIRIIPIDGPRGRIFDRNGIPMVTSRLSFDVAVVYQELKDIELLEELLNEVLGLSRDSLKRSLEKARAKPYAPVTIVEDVDKEKAIILEEASFDTRGLVIETRSKRHYIYNEAGCHIFGYLSEITEEELEALRDYGYHIKDLVGRSGLEKYYNTYLAGVDGGTQIEVDNKGRQTRVLGLKEPSNGKDLYLTIDISLQLVCDKLLGEHSGAIIVMNPEDGEVLALASHPTFDPNIFIRPDASSERLKLLRDKARHPLLNRAISGLYAPGSVFKVVIASGALEAKKITANTHFFCGGSYSLGNAKFDCWKEEGHASQNVVEGLMNSCNVFFYQTGRAMGVDNIETFTKSFGFGRPTGIDLPDESQGIVPGRLWKRLYRRDNWYEGETVNYAIGQGYLSVTPIQILQMMAVMANKGSLIRPYLVGRIESTDISNVKRKTAGLKSDVIQKVREGLFRVVNDENGTGRRAKVEGVSIAGKTGTAQNPQGRTHAWFSGFAKFNDPKICLVVFLEHGGKGGLEPAAIAKDIFEEVRDKGYI